MAFKFNSLLLLLLLRINAILTIEQPCSELQPKCCTLTTDNTCVSGTEFQCYNGNVTSDGVCYCVGNCSIYEFCWNYDANCVTPTPTSSTTNTTSITINSTAITITTTEHIINLTTANSTEEDYCKEEECDKKIDDIFKLAENFSLSTTLIDILGLVNDVNKVLNDNDSVRSTESLAKTIEIIDRMQYLLIGKTETFTEENAKQYTTDVVNIFSNLIDKKDAWSNASDDKKNELSSKLLLNLQYSAFTYGCSVRDKNEVTENSISNDNIALKTYNTFYNQSITFRGEKESFNYFELPAGIKSELFDKQRCKNTAFGAIVNNIADHMPGNDSEFSNRNEYEMNANVLSFAVINTVEVFQINDGLKTRISFANKNILEFGDKSVCVYWDFSSKKWSNNGCDINEQLSVRDITVCECTHLSYYTSITDKKHRESKTTLFLVNYIFTCVSLVALLITIPILITTYRQIGEDGSFRPNIQDSERPKRRSLIMLNICVCLIMVNIIALFHLYKKEGVRTTGDTKHEISNRCEIISSFLLLFLLSSLLWILHEAYDSFYVVYKDIYFMNKLEKNRVVYTIFFIAIGYALPTFLVLLSVLIRNRDKKDLSAEEYFCGLASKNEFWIYIFTWILVLVLMVIFSVVKINYFRRMNNFYVKKHRVVEFIFSTGLFITMVITWMFYLLYIYRVGMAYIYAFIISNCLQGIGICCFEVYKMKYLRDILRTKQMVVQNSCRTRDNNNSSNF